MSPLAWADAIRCAAGRASSGRRRTNDARDVDRFPPAALLQKCHGLSGDMIELSGDMIEEDTRHNGDADLLRECIDGS
ncbi:MAG TPA: hypothetical protein VNG12_17415 [Acidimicrobiales bacterium]|nr:hypothetical protein [Acidimicrobiales bacterium]